MGAGMPEIPLRKTPEKAGLSEHDAPAVPFQCSIRLRLRVRWNPRRPRRRSRRSPPRPEAVSLGTVGLVTSLQLVPFQCSINVIRVRGYPAILNPTAQTSLLATAATPKNWPPGPFIPPRAREGSGRRSSSSH